MRNLQQDCDRWFNAPYCAICVSLADLSLCVGPAVGVDAALQAMSRIRQLRLLGTVTALLFGAMAIQSASLEPSIPTIHFSFSATSFNAVLAQWQAAGVARFTTHFAFDFPFLVSYGVFGYALAAYTHLPRALPAILRRPFTWALPVAALMDAAENVLHLYFVHATAIPFPSLYFAAGIIATLKWLLIAAFVMGVLYAKVRAALLSRTKGRSKPMQH
jgi:hypothetical protein